MLRHIFVSALTTGFYPQLASLSPYAVVVTQFIRGFFAGIVVPYQYEFIRNWGLPHESNYLISFNGAIIPFGTGLGSLLAGLTASSIGWEYYFFICGGLFLGTLIISSAIIPETPEKCRFMTKKELSLYSNENQNGEKKLINECASWSVLLKRSYVWAFCIAHFSYNFVNYSLFNCVPFYLDEVYHLSTAVLSWSTMTFGCMIGLSMITLSKVFQTVDKRVSWIRSRMMFTLIPMALQIIIFLTIPSVKSATLFVTLVSVKALSLGSVCSGSYMTVNYDMDPQNSARIVSIFNSCAQLPGFLGPLFMVFMTETDPDTPNYAQVLRLRWDKYFYVLTCAPVVAIIVIVGSYLLRPNEWQLHSSLDKSKVIVNPSAKGHQTMDEEVS